MQGPDDDPKSVEILLCLLAVVLLALAALCIRAGP